MSDLKPGAVHLNNAAECFGFILSFLAYWSDGKWHDAEVEVMYSAVASTLKNLTYFSWKTLKVHLVFPLQGLT